MHHSAVYSNKVMYCLAVRLTRCQCAEDCSACTVHHAATLTLSVAALKGALSQLADSGDAAALLASATAGSTKSSRATAAATVAAAVASKELNLARGKEFSQRVQQLSTLLQTRDKELADAEAEAAADAAHIERLAAQRLLADLRFVTDTTTTTSSNSTNSNNSSGDLVRRVTALSEQLRTAQLSALEAQRAAAALKRERRHLEAALTAKDEDIRALEDAHSAVQTRAVLISGSSTAAAGGSGRNGGVSIDMVMLSPRGEYTGFSSAAASGTAAAGATAASGGAMHSARSELTAEERALLNEAMQPQQFDFGGLDPEQALTRLRDSSKRVVALTKALAEAKAGREQALTQCDAAEHRAAAAARELAYYARLAKESGLALNGQTNGASQGSDSPMKNGASTAANGVSAEHAKLQAAASATVASLKALLQEKNATIDRLQRRLDEAVRAVIFRQFDGLITPLDSITSIELTHTVVTTATATTAAAAAVRAERHREAGAERVEVGRLTNRIYQDNADSLEQLRRAIKQLSGGGSGLEGDGVSLNNRLMDQLDEYCEVRIVAAPLLLLVSTHWTAFGGCVGGSCAV
eukprot:4778-Heterococcus_DN1.PRE.1